MFIRSAVLIAVAGESFAFAGAIDFSRDIQPILSENCYHCHGPDAKARKAELRLDQKEGAMRVQDGVAVVKPGDSKASALIERIFTTDTDDVMPPLKSNRTLTTAQKELLRRWVDEGAKWGEHWAFVAPERPVEPGVADCGLRIADWEKRDAALGAKLRSQQAALEKWPRNPIDRFILDRLLSEGLAPSPEAPPEKLCRRLYLDLTGLPPTPEAVEEFVRECADAQREGARGRGGEGEKDSAVADGPILPLSRSPALALASSRDRAVEKLTDRLLASPRFGERMVWEWLEAARYADTNGYQGDPTRAMWYWRDWAIGAFNANLPFDQFTVEQIAGDLLPQAEEAGKSQAKGGTLAASSLPAERQAQLIATGFHRNHMINGEGGRIAEESRVDYVQDRVETTGTVWLGLTFNCCRCHDHKFDPITQREYYQLAAYFNSIDETGANDARGLANPILSLATPEQQAKFDALKVAEARVNKERAQLEKKLRAEQPAWEKSILTDRAQPAEIEWRTVALGELSSEHGATLTKQEDGSVLVSGTNADTDEFLIVATTNVRGPTAVRLEVLPDDSLAARGPGRAPNGSWVLSELRMQGEGNKVELAAARADFEQPGWPLAAALDGKDATGWGVWPQIGKAHEAIFEIKTSIAVRSSFDFRQELMLEFRLQFRSAHRQHAIGKFRLAITDAPRVLLRAIPENVRAALAVDAAKRDGAQAKTVTDFYLASEPRLVSGNKKAEDAKAQREKAERDTPRTMVMRERAEPRETFILVKGAYNQYAEKVAHGVPAKLPPLPADAPKNRLALARWLVAPENPLTARVAVNRLWQQFFGTGIVKSADNFGLQSDAPSHPELLDWLAVEFRESGWDVKRMVKLIVSSATYRQASAVAPGMAERDPENRLVARGPRHRLPSWMLRDQALAVSGLLVEKIGGPPVKTYQPPGIWEDATFGQIKFAQDHGDALYRRSLYIFWRRIVAPTVFFDVANRQGCAVKTGRTNTPLHALITMNDITFVEAARALAQRTLLGAGDDAARIAMMFRRCTARPPTASESGVLLARVRTLREAYAQDAEAAQRLLAVGESKADASISPAELAAWTGLASLALNLDETVSSE